LAGLLKHPGRSSYEIVRETWRGLLTAQDFEPAWQTAVHDGVVDGTSHRPVDVALKDDLSQPASTRSPQASELEIVFRPDPTIWDGRYANNGWLQELPKPLSKLTWDNVAQLSPATAQTLAVNNGDVLELRYKGRPIEAPAWISPGHADGSVTVTLGYG